MLPLRALRLNLPVQHLVSVKLVIVIRRYSRRKNQLIADWLIKLTDDEKDWGFGMCFD